MNNSIFSSNTSSELYKNILINFYNDMKDKINIINHKNTTNVAIIIEPRINLSYTQAVIYNFIYFMNTEEEKWNFIIYCNLKEIDSNIKSIFKNCELKQIDESILKMDNCENTNTNTYNISIDDYNKMLLDINFWKNIPEYYKNVCIFQSDCIMFSMFNNYWLNYDYAGANYDYSTIINNRIIINNKSIFSGGINGGFSIRKRETMIECIEKISWGYIQNYRQELFNLLKIKEFVEDENNNKILSPINIFIKNEDIFFTHACEILRKKMPDTINRHLLAIETSFCNNTSVYHGWNKNYHTYDKAIYLLSMSPLFSKYIKHSTHIL